MFLLASFWVSRGGARGPAFPKCAFGLPGQLGLKQDDPREDLSEI